MDVDARKDVLVSDGYGNARIAKLTTYGSFPSRRETAGSGPGRLDLPHAVEVDATGRVYVADAWGQRAQKFIRP